MSFLLKTSSNGVKNFLKCFETNVWRSSGPALFRLNKFCFGKEKEGGGSYVFRGVAYWLFDCYKKSGTPPVEAYPPNRGVVHGYDALKPFVGVQYFQKVLEEFGVEPLEVRAGGRGELEKIFEQACNKKQQLFTTV